MTSLSTQRRTIAVLIDYMNLFAGGFEAEYRRLFEHNARLHDVNLVFTYGRAVGHPDPSAAAHNRIYELLSSNCVSGVIALSSSITSFCGLDGAQTFFRRFDSLARCSVGLAIPSVPSIEIDNRTGMLALLDHLIVHHGYRRIGFIRGPVDNVEARIRFDAYCSALRAHDIEFDGRLVKAGNFGRRAGQTAAEELLAQDVDLPQALVAANDGMALGAISYLRAKGIRIPGDMAVAGFDGLIMSRLSDPPLTTVAQPIERMVGHAFELILDQLAQREVPETARLDAQFVIRESCGCGGIDRALPMPRSESVCGASNRAIVRLALQKCQTGDSSRERFREDYRADLLAALAREFTDAPGSVIAELNRILSSTEDTEVYQVLQRTISALRREFSRHATPELDDLWFSACTHVALTNSRRQEQLRLDHDQAYYRWIDVGEGFGAALDVATLTPALTVALQNVGIEHAYVSRYTDAALRELECIVALRNGAAYTPPASRFPADCLVPIDSFPPERRVTFLAFPLAFHACSLGIAVFEIREGIGGYPIIRDQISAVLQSIRLHQEIVDQTRLHERNSQEQERLATAKRIQSLSVLAGGVAHDLNNVLGPLVALPDLMTTELRRVASESVLAETNLEHDLDAIKVAALRATQTIKDLLTLGRQGHTAKEVFDVNQLIERQLTQGGKHLNWPDPRVSIDLCNERLFVLGSETHIGRAIVNLVRNALDAVDARGHVFVRSQSVTVGTAIAGYETIEPGDYTVIAISDTGCGIARADLNRLFEPFFSLKRLNDQSGSGLGLAIVHGVVKEHGGYINVESVVDRGTTFTLYLPRSAAVDLRNRVSSAAPRGQERILVVDDEPLQLRTCRRVLTHLGYTVTTVSSAEQALAEVQFNAQPEGMSRRGGSGCPYDLVILDLYLNDSTDGLGLFDRIRALYPLQRGIIVSGHAPSLLIEQAAERGLGWLAKPYTQSALARAVHLALSEERNPGRINGTEIGLVQE